jgi:hypothetical protein
MHHVNMVSLVGSSSHTGSQLNSLTDYIADYQPVYYDQHSIGGALRRSKRSVNEEILLKFHAYGR